MSTPTPYPLPPTPYCSYILGDCALGYGSAACKKRNPIECRNCRQKLEQERRAQAAKE